MQNTVIASEEFAGLRNYYQHGVTRPYAFRMRQLQLLKQTVLQHEREIIDALYSDLKKSEEETYATETGLLLAEISLAMKKLRKWMKPRPVSTNLVNLPSSSAIYRDPLGVVLIIAAWNYPLQLTLIPLVGAIAGGNCAVLKPSELAPATAEVIGKMIRSVYPPEYIRVLQGEGSVVVPAAMEQFRFDHIFYTGSVATGKLIYQAAAKDLIPVTLELGGKNPAVIEQDADLTTAARRIALGKFANAGQTCIAPDYVLVHSSIKQKFIGILKDTIEQFFSAETQESSYGKIINEKRFDTLASYLGQGKIVAGGLQNRSSLFFGPVVLTETSPDAAVMNDEIFGPVLPVIDFTTIEEALATINRHSNPLAFYVFTGDKKKEKFWMANVAFGGGCINNTLWHFANPQLPFGGTGHSGIGAYHGRYSFDTFTHAKPVMKTPTWFDPDLKYPPFKGKLKWFKMFIR